MGRKRIYTDEENRARARARAAQYNRRKAREVQTKRWGELIKYIRRHDSAPTDELANKLTKKWRLLKQYKDVY